MEIVLLLLKGPLEVFWLFNKCVNFDKRVNLIITSPAVVPVCDKTQTIDQSRYFWHSGSSPKEVNLTGILLQPYSLYPKPGSDFV